MLNTAAERFQNWGIFGESQWIFRKVSGDLFTAPEEYALAHCVAVDLQMGAGIATRFRYMFGGVAALREQNPKVGGLAVLKAGKRTVYYLVTKRISSQKPKYADLLRSLIAMRAHMKSNGVRKLAIPKIGCGLDRLKWDKVFDILQRVFDKDNIEIVLHEYNSTH